jgi:hypothetical protein
MLLMEGVDLVHPFLSSCLQKTCSGDFKTLICSCTC